MHAINCFIISSLLLKAERKNGHVEAQLKYLNRNLQYQIIGINVINQYLFKEVRMCKLAVSSKQDIRVICKQESRVTSYMQARKGW